MKMRSTPKAKLDIHGEMPLQLILANSIEKHVVNTADSNTLNMSLEKRKEDARKPLYLKRV